MEQVELLGGESAEERKRRLAEARERRRAEAAKAAPRVVRAERSQLRWEVVDLDGELPQTHRARSVLAVVKKLNLSAFYERIKARGSWAGRDATDPQVLLALWLYATAEGVGSARELERLTEQHVAYRWLRGGVPVNYHTLSTFRSENAEALEELFTQVLAVMMAEGLVRLRRVAQDGTRVRASAGDRSFRRRKKVEELRAEVRRQIEALRGELEAPARRSLSRRKQAAQRRALEERERRLTRALEELGALEREREGYKKGAKEPSGEPRSSTTDPEARVMRQTGGAYLPGYNVQLATDAESEVVVGVEVSQGRTDFAEAVPMLEQLERRFGRLPEQYVVDTGYTSVENVEELSARGVELYGALPKRKGKPDPYEVRPRDSEAVRQLKERMRTPEGRAIYGVRARVSERVHADLKRWRTLGKIVLRGRTKVRCIVLLNVITYNLLRWFALLAAAGGS
ncbi:MAG: hypothetical protein KatS3mg076_1520 [Candidatus Binatia bacterium]|nr:MAG: hypothetical protein KatS3mg076_1027 [Candidatus Binatia bacterium]GIW40943.1 MAG: hypothetical protein KatS3mg076_1520 [Candidatus Binatia bacterium]